MVFVNPTPTLEAHVVPHHEKFFLLPSTQALACVL